MQQETTAAAIIAAPYPAECRIYAACLAAYNDGRLHGEWIDCDGKSAAEIGRDINAMLARSPSPNVMRRLCNDCGRYQDVSPYRDSNGDASQCDGCGGDDMGAPFASAEEWAIHDYEGFNGWNPGEYASLDDVATVAEILCDGPDESKARGFRFLLWLGRSVQQAIEGADDVVMMEGRPAQAVEAWHDECGMIDELPEWARFHIDFESIAHDWQTDGNLIAWTDPHDSTDYCIFNGNSL